ncbi:MAG: putative DNA binding domain-containing protein [Spirochaetaceae bacterium]|nr:putative DNA binding domain-containing protein [Spirochaetaceae bacterium]
MTDIELRDFVAFITQEYSENEWGEYKHNFHSKEEIGERISALSNSACLNNKPYAYLIYGVEDTTRKIIGTNFHALSKKIGNEELEIWLRMHISPRIDYETIEFDYAEDIHISMYKIPAASRQPVAFNNRTYVRVNSVTKFLSEFPEKEAKIWRNTPEQRFEEGLAKENVEKADLFDLLDTQLYFDLMKIPYPSDQIGIIERFEKEKLIVKAQEKYNITNLGAILFAKRLENFDSLKRKAIRVICYKNNNKLETIREITSAKGYALGLEGLVEWINGQLPANEQIGTILRQDKRMYPEIAIRELVANMIVHQDFFISGSPMVEIYSDRIEFSNPGVPIIQSDRFIDEYAPRNDLLADIMRRMRFCEEKGSGMDKVIFYNELYQLPAVKIAVQENRTVVTLYSHKTWSETSNVERMVACYQHACLKYVSNEQMSNQSLRERFKIEEQNAAMVSRVIKATLEKGLIKEFDPESNSRKNKRYIPYWA